MLKKFTLTAVLLFAVSLPPAAHGGKMAPAAGLSAQEKAFAKYEPADPESYLKLVERNDLMADGRKALARHDHAGAERIFRKALQLSVDAKLPVGKVVESMDYLRGVY